MKAESQKDKDFREAMDNSLLVSQRIDLKTCKHCHGEIKDKAYQNVWYQSGYEDIDIGPYCPECFNKVKICQKCQYPKVLENHKGIFFCENCIVRGE